jgi:hypothetical protein
MDSMDSLHGSLPFTSRRRNAVLVPFRETARTLTNLFKTASAEIDRAYTDGARDALDQLLGQMDRESLGLSEGEGWRVRQLIMGIIQTQSNSSWQPAEEDMEQDDQKPAPSSPLSSPTQPSPVARHTSSERNKAPDFDNNLRHKMPDLQPTPNTRPVDVLLDENDDHLAAVIPTPAAKVATALRMTSSAGLGPGAGVKRRASFIDPSKEQGAVQDLSGEVKRSRWAGAMSDISNTARPL